MARTHGATQQVVTPTVTIRARLSRDFRTYLQHITGPAAPGATSKAGKALEFAATYPDAVAESKPEALKFEDGRTVMAAYRIWQIGDGTYALCQPSQDFSEARDMSYFAVRNGQIVRTTLDAIRAGYGMAAKAGSKSSKTFADAATVQTAVQI